MNDNVNHPSHYTFGEIECIDAIHSALGDDLFYGYCWGNALKYLWRHRYKDNDKQDLDKCKWYIEKMQSEVIDMGKRKGCGK